MKALQLIGNERLALIKKDAPVNPGVNEVIIKTEAITLNHLDLFSYRGMAFAKREFPITVGAEGVGTVVSTGQQATQWQNKRVAIYPSFLCGHCVRCKAGQENLCENLMGTFGFSAHGLASEFAHVPAHLLVEIPNNLSWTNAACAPITVSTVVHMLMDNAKLCEGETVLIHAAGSGIGTVAIRLAKWLGAQVIATAGSDEKCRRALSLGADFAINYRNTLFVREVRKITEKRGVDVVFEHVGTDTWEGSLACLTKAGRLVTCGSTSGVDGKINLFQLFNQHLRIIGSFGSTKQNIIDALRLMNEENVLPVIDSVYTLDDYEHGLKKLRSRDVFGKIVIQMENANVIAANEAQE